ncbi:calcium ATPase transmembrane domain M-containing protein [Pisolithus orientalis]|uniref:calcium ATPase transmembrane domain M-containing protein n=1 Tax=Pisolithus orientalis TaxID=936130 RepID=UPI0022247786|nr:calcium ATPase transmembrane domain M-containing protein [Pisolithus orientalis]KAI5987958.1 calcium ATPase transmembrane domain M-containing protein [Pisolithus orientalis]
MASGVGLPTTNTRTSGRIGQYGLQIGYRTLSVRVEERDLPAKPKPSADPADAIAAIDVHLIDVEDVCTRYSTHPTRGLEDAAVQRKAKEGKNVISSPPTQYWKKAFNYVFGGFNFLMWIAFILTLLSYQPLGEPSPQPFVLGVAILLIFVIAISATFYALVDWNASRIMRSIKTLIAEHACVIRDGQQQLIPAADIVVGDVVVLNSGDRVPADLRIVQASSDLRFDRSLLTGESEMIPGALDATSKNALETRNLALNSTFVTQGNCTGVVFATGDRSVMGRLVSMSGEKQFKLTTIQREVWFFTKIISCLALFFFGLSLLLYGVWLRTTYPGYDTTSTAIVNSIGCLTAFVPQGLPICVALSLTVIARRMAKRQVLVKNLATVETLGCMSVLCSDKTGTLTAGRMVVQNIAFLNHHCSVKVLLEKLAESSTPADFAALKVVHQIARLCNAAKFDAAVMDCPIEERAIKGDPTDTALLRFSEGLSVPSLDIDTSSLLKAWERRFEISFNSRNKWAMTVVEDNNSSGSVWMLVKGAPDVLFPYCQDILQGDGTSVPLGDSEREQLSALQNKWSSEGQRVLALSLDGIKLDLPPNTMEELLYSELRDLTLVSLIGIRDLPRDDVPSSIETIRKAGVRVFMVTGDFKLTAVAISRQAKRINTIADIRMAASEKVPTRTRHEIKPRDDDPIRALVLTGEDVSSLTSADWDVVVGSYMEVVFARTTPDQKMKIVQEIKCRGDNTVAVTGDGINDVPALKAADIGVAMGAGSDVAKEAAALILLKNDFASIPVAIEMGRLVFDNLRKVSLYLLPAGSYTEFMAVFSNVLLGMQIPMTTYQQVCFCIANDVVMSISLMYEKAESDLMLRKPRNARKDRLTDWRLFLQVYLFIGLMLWPSAMGMWFLYMSRQGLGFYDVILVYNKWQDGWKGYSQDQLNHFVNVGQCIYYVTLVFGQYGGLLAVRNRRVSILHSNPFWGPRKNLIVPCGMIATALIAVVNLYGPGIQHVFGTTPIPGMYWGLAFCFPLIILIMDELRKLLVRTYPKSFVAYIAW